MGNGSRGKIKNYRIRFNAGKKDFETVYHLASLNWYRQNIPDAYEHMKIAHQLAPENSQVHFSLAFLAEMYNRSDAKKLYSEIINRYPQSIWKVYAELQLENSEL